MRFFLFLIVYVTIFCGFESKTLIDVGVILDMDSQVGEMAKFCISTALSDFYNVNPNYETRLILHTRDSKEDIVSAAFGALDLLKNVGVEAIIGPMRSTETKFVVELGGKAHVPIISFSATSPALSPIQNPYFVRAAQDDTAQVKAITAIVQGFEWREVVLIYEDTEYESEISPYLTDAFLEVDIRISCKSAIPSNANDDQILKELNKLRQMRVTVFLVHMSTSLGSRLFLLANKAGMVSEGYAWVITDALSISLDSIDPMVIDSMEGVLGIRPCISRSKNLKNFKGRWKRYFPLTNPKSTISELNTFGLWAYDAAWALAMAVERIGQLNSSLLHINNGNNTTDLSSLGVSQMGPMLLEEMLNTSFRGLSGKFHLVNGQLQPSAFEIFNVIGNGERIVGYWTPDEGISRELSSDGNAKYYSTSTSELKTIIWPGDTTTKPQGWAIPIVNELKIGIPFKQGFTEFVKIENPDTSKVNYSGFSIDVFLAVRDALPFKVHYKFLPYMVDNKSKGTYDELVYQIYNKSFDAVVGDVTIIANRSSFVDFTLPYSDSGVSMVVPATREKPKSMWTFMKPLTWDLWLTIAITWIVTGIAMWSIEHHVRTTLRDSNNRKLETIIWLPFYSLVLPENEPMENRWTKFVLVLWLALACILMQSYTASLSSILTVEHLQPKVLDVTELVERGYYVGYQEDSFVRDLLINQLNFEKSKLISYSTVEDYHEALSNGTVAAIFDEIPYIKLFLGKYCSKYVMAGPTYRTEGFGFAFPLGSPLVSYFSRAVLNVTEGKKIDNIQKRYFHEQSSCPEQTTIITTDTPSLTAYSFGGLFMIVIVAILVALMASKRISLLDMVNSYGQKFIFRYFRGTQTRTKPALEMGNRGGGVEINNPVVELEEISSQGGEVNDAEEIQAKNQASHEVISSQVGDHASINNKL
ncbi:Solute-binding protein family 3/N-terminal domain of MltF [Dillenia turbinata]|uniref:Glutamate receptor n=1 Tax=Dillenia turbinata TaxID=194707 RepID=A0AAN8VYW1_9MAGN